MKNKLICIIDDDPIYQILVNKIIAKSNCDYSVLSFNNGMEAIESLNARIQSNESLPEIILLDLQMPVMDGWDFMNKIKKDLRKETEGIAIYLVSSSISYEDKEKAKSFPEILGFFSKPITGDRILEITKKN